MKAFITAWFTISTNQLVYGLSALFIGWHTIACAWADTALNESNRLGSPGSYHWLITTPGSYYLDITESTLSTSNEYAIWIATGDVTLDGRGKIISGPAIPASSSGAGTYGVRVNGGLVINNVVVKNISVEKKFFGVIFEAVDFGEISSVNAAGNGYGLYLWKVNHVNLRANSANTNLYTGIVCDGDQVVNSYNHFTQNTANNNGDNGISLWLACTYNSIFNNVANNNSQMGVSLSHGADFNTLEQNSLSSNSSGIWVGSSNGNAIGFNRLFSNSNVGVMLQSAHDNVIQSNLIESNLNAGIWLDEATKNHISTNRITHNTFWGIFLSNGSLGQSIYNNYLLNLGNAGFSNDGGSNTWNHPLQPGRNIISGKFLGGNFWGTLDGQGISQTCADDTHDGICNSAYQVASFGGGSQNIDSFPLRLIDRRMEFDLSRDGATDLAGLTSGGQIYYTDDLSQWSHVSGTLASLVGGDFDADGQVDGLAGLTVGGLIFYSNDLEKWLNIPGILMKLIAGDFNGDGRTDLAGISSNGSIFYTIDLQTWVNIPGQLTSLVSGDFNGDGIADLAGISSGGNPYYSTDLAHWTLVPGLLSQIVADDFDGDGLSDLAGINTSDQIFVTMDLTNWEFANGSLAKITVGDLDGNGHADLAGLTSQGDIFYTLNLVTWGKIPGKLATIKSGDFNGDGVTDLAGTTSGQHIYYSTDRANWILIPGQLATLAPSVVPTGSLNDTGNVAYADGNL